MLRAFDDIVKKGFGVLCFEKSDQVKATVVHEELSQYIRTSIDHRSHVYS
jgi:hypothetical protein